MGPILCSSGESFCCRAIWKIGSSVREGTIFRDALPLPPGHRTRGVEADGQAQSFTHAAKTSGSKEDTNKNLSEQVRCLTGLQRHARAQAWPRAMAH